MQMMGRVSGEERLQSRRISLTCNHVSSEVNEIGTSFECFKAIQVPQDLRTYQCTSLEARNSTEQMTSCGCFCNSAMNSPGSNCRKGNNDNVIEMDCCMVFGRNNNNFILLMTWLPTTALMPSLMHSCLTSSAIEVKGTTNTVVEPEVKLGLTHSLCWKVDSSSFYYLVALV